MERGSLSSLTPHTNVFLLFVSPRPSQSQHASSSPLALLHRRCNRRPQSRRSGRRGGRCSFCDVQRGEEAGAAGAAAHALTAVEGRRESPVARVRALGVPGEARCAQPDASERGLKEGEATRERGSERERKEREQGERSLRRRRFCFFFVREENNNAFPFSLISKERRGRSVIDLQSRKQKKNGGRGGWGSDGFLVFYFERFRKRKVVGDVGFVFDEKMEKAVFLEWVLSHG